MAGQRPHTVISLEQVATDGLMADQHNAACLAVMHTHAMDQRFYTFV